MKTKDKKTKEKDKWSLSGEPLSTVKLKEVVKKAEEGPFYTVEESQKILEKWRIKRDSR